ncbi:MAG: GDP-L-fucose synthase [Spirochaetes bacterium]|nr:MAG: GDP-L-fucose synthase [Spirochaetota bacterium]RKX93305.1 MAG: GDP-L-fucose synthase [Spirochaetota bacterium]
MNKKDKIYIAGHNGLVGRAIVSELENQGYENLLMKRSAELDLRNQSAVNTFFEKEKPDFVFLAAARVGGILANSTMKGDFIYDNLMIASNIIKASKETGVKKLLNLGSSCIYPKLADQPLKETALLSGYLEPTNESYAIAKIAAIKLCTSFNHQYGTNFISAMPTNLYGPNDNFNLETSHVLPAMLRKFHEAKVNNTEVELWGDGSPYREFLYSQDLAEGLVFLMNHVDAPQMPEGFVNIGTGEDLTIRNLAELIQRIVGFTGSVTWDATKPNGTPRKVMDISGILELGWKPKTTLEDGIRKVYQWFLSDNR